MTARDELVTLLSEHDRQLHTGGDGYVSPREAWETCSCGAITWQWQQFYAETDEDPNDAWDAHLADVILAAGWTKGDA